MEEDDEYLSDCCGAGPANDEGLCPQCRDHCAFVDEDGKMENGDEP